jgi:hypothetical protein
MPRSVREHKLEEIARVGSSLCGYTLPGGDWTKVRCDCKFGGPRPDVAVGGEQTGCPEIRSVYRLISAMTDQEFDQLVIRYAQIRGLE